MVICTPYTRGRMTKRGISAAEVCETVEDPEVAYPSKTNPRREVRVRTFGERRIAVVVEARGAGKFLAVTTYDQNADD